MIVFRVDANSTVATGHLYRCLSIAKKCREIGLSCLFLLADPDYAGMIEEAGFAFKVLDLRFDDWDYHVSLVKEELSLVNASCLVVDSYRVTKNFFHELHEFVPIFYLDDLCREVYEVSAVLHYSEWEDDNILGALYAGSDAKVYTGMKYMPLREECSKASACDEKKYDLLVTTGGTDPCHVTLKLLKELCRDDLGKELKICAVLGRYNTDACEIRGLEESFPEGHLTVMQNINNMPEVMHASRCALTSGGTTVYELMASGVPFICIGFSDDQIFFGKRLDAHGNAIWAGDAREEGNFIKNLQDTVLAFTQKTDLELGEISSKNKKTVDGKGALRIAEILKELSESKTS